MSLLRSRVLRVSFLSGLDSVWDAVLFSRSAVILQFRVTTATKLSLAGASAFCLDKVRVRVRVRVRFAVKHFVIGEMR